MTLSNVMVLTVKAMAEAREVIALLLLMQARLDGVSRMKLELLLVVKKKRLMNRCSQRRQWLVFCLLALCQQLQALQ